VWLRCTAFSDCTATADGKSVASAERVSEANVSEDDHETSLLKADSRGSDTPAGNVAETDGAMQLSSIDVSPIAQLFNWLD